MRAMHINIYSTNRQPNFDHSRLRDVERYIRKKVERQYILKKCNKKDEEREYFICSHHESEKITKKHKYIRNGKEQTCSVSFDAPTGLGMKAQALPQTASRGLGCDRDFNRNINQITTELS